MSGGQTHTGAEIAARYRHTTPYYDLVVLTSPARIESLAVDPTGRGRHLGVVNNYGPTGSAVFAAYGPPGGAAPTAVMVAGRPDRVRVTPDQLWLERLPVGDRGMLADWTFTFHERTFDITLDWRVAQPQTELWEAGWALDGVAREVAGPGSAAEPPAEYEAAAGYEAAVEFEAVRYEAAGYDAPAGCAAGYEAAGYEVAGNESPAGYEAGLAGARARLAYLAWSEPDPRYAHTLVTAYAPGSADRGDRVRAAPAPDRPVTVGVWATVAAPGGTGLSAGLLRGGRWRVGASGLPDDRRYAAALAAELTGGPPALPAPGPAGATGTVWSDRDAAVGFGARLGSPVGTDGSGGPEPLPRCGPDGAWLLSDGQVLVAFVPRDGAYRAWLYVASDGCWQLAATAGPEHRFTDVVDDDVGGLAVRGELCRPDGAVAATTRQTWRLRAGADQAGEPAAAAGSVQVQSVDTPVGGQAVPSAYHAQPLQRPAAAAGSGGAGTTGSPPRPQRWQSSMHRYIAYPGGRTAEQIDRYDVLASPSLRPQADLVIGQRAFWAPAIQVQHGDASVALVPDLLVHRQPGRHSPMPTHRYFAPTLDLDVADRRADAPVLAFGWRATEGVFGYYYRDLGDSYQDLGETSSRSVELAYDLVLRAGAAPHSAVSDVQRRLWAQVGRRYFTQSRLPQAQPADRAFAEAWSHWRDGYDSRQVGGRLLGAVRIDRETPPDANFMSWFNALRSSYGLASHGRDRGDPDLVALGRATLELLLAAPQERGAFPTIAGFRDGGFDWSASHRNFLDQMPWGPTSYATFDMGWAAYWLLRWYQDLAAEPRALAFARRYGELLLEVQLPSGAVPSWLAVGSLAVDPHLRESAQTASSVMFLAELARVTGEPRFREAAARAGAYVAAHHLRTQRWDDFEPYYSNAPKSEGACDPFSGQYPQNTLSMHFAAIGFLTLYELTGEPGWLADGRRTVDTLLQYQYITPGLGLSLNGFGGFAVQNTDNEAVDARQSQIGVTLLDYARVTGVAEYAERGIAALRAGYATMASPSAEIINPRYFDAHPVGRGPENYAHATHDAPAEYTVFDWGQGSAAAGFAEARNRFGDVWVDARRRVAYGIDDVHVERVHWYGADLSLELSSPAPSHLVTLKVDDLDPDPPVQPSDRDKPTDREEDQPAGRGADLHADREGEQPAGRGADLHADREGEQPAGRGADLHADREGKQPADGDAVQPSDQDEPWIRLRVNGGPVQVLDRRALAAGVRVPTRQRVRIFHNPFRAPAARPGEPFPITARISSADPVVQATLHHRVADGSWATVPMTPVGEGTWTAAVPAESVRAAATLAAPRETPAGGRLEYYLTAATATGDTGQAPEVDPAEVPYWRYMEPG